jgi:FlaA1/EpsC-like NDP-sugar epimerase
MTIDQAVKLVFQSAETARGGEIFVLPMPKIRIIDLIRVVIEEECARLGCPPETITINEIGKRSGERCHEELLTPDEARRALYRNGLVVISPFAGQNGTGVCQKDFSSATGPFLSHNEITELVRNASGVTHTESREFA